MTGSAAAPASSANLGPAFDCMALALDLWCRADAEPSDGWEITEDGEHAVLYSTHVLSDINRLADELVFLRDGQLLLRTGREELGERWRRVSFRHQDADIELVGVVEHRSVRAEHQVITKDAPSTLEQLGELGAEAVEVSRMSVDEIAVLILKEGHHVARTER